MTYVIRVMNIQSLFVKRLWQNPKSFCTSKIYSQFYNNIQQQITNYFLLIATTFLIIHVIMLTSRYPFIIKDCTV